MRKAVLTAVLACAAACGHAAETGSGSGIVPFVGLGLTFGGDQIGQDIRYESGNSSSIHAGGLVDLRAGIEYRLTESPVSLQFSVGYHSDGSLAASNGSASFNRIPVELLAHYSLSDSWRIGGGLRKALSAEAKSSGNGTGYVPAQKYESDLAFVLEAETFFGPRFGLKIRAVSEKYKPELTPNQDVDGSHIGVIGVYYFK